MSENVNSTPIVNLDTVADPVRQYALSPAGMGIVRAVLEYFHALIDYATLVTPGVYIGGLTREGMPTVALPPGPDTGANVDSNGNPAFELLRAEADEERRDREFKEEKIAEYMGRSWNYGSQEERLQRARDMFETEYGRGQYETLATIRRNLNDEFGIPPENITATTTVQDVIIAALVIAQSRQQVGWGEREELRSGSAPEGKGTDVIKR